MTNIAPTRVCPNCGRHVLSDLAFCDASGCGTYLGWAANAVSPAPSSEPDGTRILAPPATLPTQRTPHGPEPQFTLRLSEHRVDVTPGETAELVVLVRNNGPVVDQFQLDMDGPLSRAAVLTPELLRVYPGQEDGARVTFAPPVAPLPPAGDVPFTVRAVSREGRQEQAVHGLVGLGRCGGVASELFPQKTRGRWWAFHAAVGSRNDSNVPQRLSLSAEDPERRLRWDPPSLVWDLAPGATSMQRLKGRSKLRWMGSEESLPFVASVWSVAFWDEPQAGSVQALDGVRVQRALLPRWLLPALLALAVAVAGLVMLAGGADAVRVPSVAGSPEDEAVAAIEAVGLSVRVEERSSEDVPSGDVIATDPEASTSLEPGDSVTVFVSQGPPEPEETTVPNLVGKHIDEVESLLAENDLELGEVLRATDPDTERGLVLRTTPEAGDAADIGSEVAVVVSKGPPPPQQVPVPAVRDVPLSTAEAELVDAGLVVGDVTEEPSDDVAEGNVIRTTPTAGEQVDPGTAVDLVVSSGPEVIEQTGAVPAVLIGAWNGGPGNSSDFYIVFTAEGRYEMWNDVEGFYDTGALTVDGDTMIWTSDSGDEVVMGWDIQPDGFGGDLLVLDGGASSYVRAD